MIAINCDGLLLCFRQIQNIARKVAFSCASPLVYENIILDRNDQDSDKEMLIIICKGQIYSVLSAVFKYVNAECWCMHISLFVVSA